MAKFADLTKGHRARRRGVPFRTLEGAEVPVDVQIIGGAGQARILEYATKFARERGCEPLDGQAVFEFGKNVMTCALGILAHEEPPAGADPAVTAPGEPAELFFAGPEEVLEACDRDRAAYLAACQELLQEQVSPRRRGMTDDEFWVYLAQILEGEEAKEPGFFAQWERSMLWSFVLTMAHRLAATLAQLASLTSKSSATSDSSGVPIDSSSSGAIISAQ